MTAVERARTARRAVVAGVLARAVLWSGAAAFVAWGVADLATRTASATTTARLATTWGSALGVFVVVALVLVGLGARRATLPRVALWLEERTPSLQYALVTAVERAERGMPAGAALEAQVAGGVWGPSLRRALGRSFVAPAIAMLLAAGFAMVASHTIITISDETRATEGHTGGVGTRGATSPLARVTAVVRAPAYAGGGSRTVEDPAVLQALVGSVITVRGARTDQEVSAEIGERALGVRTGEGEWSTTLTLDAPPAILRLRAAGAERLIGLEPVIDSAPVVRLTSPVRDTVYRAAAGTVALRAELRDDHGLTQGAFEYIVSSGEGESFTFRSGTLGGRGFERARTGALAASLSLEQLGLVPGDVVHLRAVARDANDITGPGRGVSETRVLRIARAGEYDSVAVEAAPPPEADKSMLSQRMLVMLTEALEARRPKLARAALLAESRNLAREQNRLRKSVGDIVFSRLGDDVSGEHSHEHDEDHAADSSHASHAEAVLRAAEEATRGHGGEALDFEGGETPVVAVNRPLLEAYNHMWDASRHLELGETKEALPPMYRALAAIQRARQAERIYLRGRAPHVVVDIARVRLQGKDRGAGSERVPRTPLDPASERRLTRFLAAVASLSTSPQAAIDSLLVIRIQSVDARPEAARALDEAIQRLREGRDATAALMRARSALADVPRERSPLTPWSRAW